jgi:hypothetical protein
MDYKTLDAIPAHNFYYDTIVSMIEDGWTLNAGPWGNKDGDDSVVLTREHNGGNFIVWFISRDIHQYNNKIIRDNTTHAWYKVVKKHPQIDINTVSEKAIPVPDHYEWFRYLMLVNSWCQQGGHFASGPIVQVGFAGSACDVHLEKGRAEQEFKGWTD